MAQGNTHGIKGTLHGCCDCRWNPFDSQLSSELMLHPTLSPGVFSSVISPSQESEHTGGRFWSIDQQVRLTARLVVNGVNVSLLNLPGSSAHYGN